VFQRVSKNEPETDASPDPVKTAPGSFDGSSELETNAALPASGQAPKVSPDPDDWDEGTAAEWNPRWSEANKLREQELSSKNQAVDPRKGARILRWLLPLIGLCAVVILAAFVFIPRFKASAVDTPSPRSIPPALQAYHDKAEAGDLAAMRMLGLRYCYGLAAPADRNEGIKWLRRAAKNGNAAARQELASMGVGMD
jgi:hypothetical protein